MRGSRIILVSVFLGCFVASARSQTQDRLLAKVVVEGAVGSTMFSATGVDHTYFDTYSSNGLGTRGGLVIRIPVTERFRLRMGAGAGTRQFRSFTYDYRVPVTSQQTGYSGPNEKTTELTYLSGQLGCDWSPWAWISLVLGAHFPSAMGVTTSPYEPAVPLEVGPELMGGLDLWPVHRMGIMFRYMHGLRPIRDQNVVLWPEVYQRTTTWRTIEFGVLVSLSRKSTGPGLSDSND